MSLPTSNPNKTSGHASESLVSPALLPKHCGQNRELRPKFNVRRVFKSYSVITGSMCKPKMDTPFQKPWRMPQNRNNSRSRSRTTTFRRSLPPRPQQTPGLTRHH